MGVFVKVEKCFLIIANIIFMLLAIASVCLGAVLIYRMDHTDNKYFTLSQQLQFLPKTLVIMGVAMAILYFIGLWGACRGKTFMLQVYASILLVILLLKGGLFVYMMFMPETTKHESTQLTQHPMDPSYEFAFQNYDSSKEDFSSLFVDAVQIKFTCCGYKNPEEMNFNGTYPWSCCGIEYDACTKPLYTTGCYYKMKDVNLTIWLTARISYYIVIILQVLCMIASFHLSSTIGKRVASKENYLRFT